MKRKEDFPIVKVTLNLFEGDWEKLQTWYPKLGGGKVVRELVRAHVRANEEKFNQTAEPVRLNISIEELSIEESK